MLKEIRKQPDHIRSLFMWLSVFIVFSAVLYVWVSSFQQRLAFLLDGSEEKALVEATSPFAIIGSSAGDLKAAVLGLFRLDGGTKDYNEIIESVENRAEQKIKPRLLPVSE